MKKNKIELEYCPGCGKKITIHNHAYTCEIKNNVIVYVCVICNTNINAELTARML